MAADLLGASAEFRAAVQECADALAPKGVDLMAEFARPGGWGAPALATVGLCATQASICSFLCGCALINTSCILPGLLYLHRG